MTTLTLALALLLPQAALAAEGPKRPAKPDLAANVPEYSLTTNVFYCPSGLTVMFQEDHSHPIVSIMSIVDHGSSDDPEGKDETAHFVEHTWFRSTQTVETEWDKDGNPIPRQLPTIMDVLQDYGTLFNATTRNDWTDYRTVFAADHLDMFLQLESRRLTSPYVGVTADQIATEREVIANEWRRRNDQGYSRLFDYIYEAVYPPGHPYHSTSTKETLARVDLETLQTYMDSYYRPDTTTIMVVGDFDVREATSLMFKNFDPSLIDPKLKPEHIFRYPAPGVSNPEPSNPEHWWFGAYDPDKYDPKLPGSDQEPYSGFLMPAMADEKGVQQANDQAAIDARVRIKPTDVRDEVPPAGSKGLVKREAPIDNRVVMAAWSLPGGFREDHSKIEMIGPLANSALQQWFNPSNYRMYQEEWRSSDIAGGSCFVQMEKVHSTLMCLVDVKNNDLDPEQLAEKIVDQMPTIWNPDQVIPLEQQSFPRARQENLSTILKSVDNVAYHFGGRAEDIVTYAHYTGSPKYHSNAMNQTMSLKALDVATMASKYLTRARAVTVVVDPLPTSKIDTSGEGSQYAGASTGDSMIEANEAAKSITPDTIKAAFVKPDLSQVVDEKLANGMRVIVLPHGDAPVAYSAIVFRGGLYTNDKDRHWFMDTFTRSEGIDPYGVPWLPGADPLQIAGEFSGGFGSDNAYYALRHAAGNVDGAMWMLREEVEGIKPSLEGKAEFVKGIRKSFAAQWTSRSAGWLVGERTDRHLYPDAPIRWDTSWEELDQFESWTIDDLKATMADFYQPANATLIVTGKITDPQAVLEDAKKYFGGWEPLPGATTDLDKVTTVPKASFAEGTNILVFDDPKRTQTQISGGCRLDYKGEEQEPVVDVLSSVIGNEIFTRIRVKEGLAYSPGGYAYVDVGDAAVLGFSSLSVNDGAGRTVEIMRELVDSAEDGKFDQALVNVHKLREARNRGLEAQSTIQMGSRLRRIAVDQLPPSELALYGERVAAVDAPSIQKLVEGCSDRMLFTMNGPASVITPQLDKLGYTYEIVDWKAEGEARFAKYDPKGFKKYQKAKAKNAAKEAAAEADAPADPAGTPTP